MKVSVEASVFRVPIDTHDAKYRFYLTWITSLPKPGADGAGVVKISELVFQIPAAVSCSPGPGIRVRRS